MKQLITILILSCVLFSCKKSSNEEESYTMSGQVVDFDDNTPIAGAKVYVKEVGVLAQIVDSAISDANGKVSFTYRKEGAYKYLFPAKANYLNPINLIGVDINNPYKSATYNLFLAKPSFVNVTVHKQGTFMPLDTLEVVIYGTIGTSNGQTNTQSTLLRDRADAPDKIFNLQTVYGHLLGSIFFGASKLYFTKSIVRNASVISTQNDSTDIIQFGTRNFTLNY